MTTTDDAERLVENVRDAGRDAHYTEDRDDLLTELVNIDAGEAVVVMGARDDGLTALAHSMLLAIKGSE